MIFWIVYFFLITPQWSQSICNGEVDGKLKNSATQKKLKILGVFGHPGKSHFIVFQPLLEELARHGHDLTVVSYFPRSNDSLALPNYKDISLAEPEVIFEDIIDLRKIKHNILTPFAGFFLIRQWGITSCERNLQKKSVKKLIESNETFDIILTEQFNTDCFIAFAHHFNAPSIGVSSTVMTPWASSRMLNPDIPSYVPTIRIGYSPEMNFFQRMWNTFIITSVMFMYDFFVIPETQRIVENAFGKKFPALTDIASNISIILVNSHFSLNGAKPNLPNIVEVGGLHIKNDQQLSDEWKEILDHANEGILLFSWGSIVKASSMPNETLNEILQVLGSIPRKVIWKWEENDLFGKPPNVIIRKWIPQSAILHHPNVKCFLAHGGLMGLSEGVSAGVPMVIVPILGDQFHNAATAEYRKVAVVVKWEEFNAKSLRNAIDLVFNDSSYQKNAKKLQKAWHDRNEKPVETAVWWIEYIGRGNGNEYLKTSASSLRWFQRYLLDVALAFLIFLSVTIFVIYCLIIALMKSCQGLIERLPRILYLKKEKIN